MGAVKDDMKPTTDKAKTLLGMITSKKKKPDDKADAAKTFCDMLTEVDTRLEKLLTTKEAELKTEKGREDYNTLALARLRTMRFHLDELINVTAEYSQS